MSVSLEKPPMPSEQDGGSTVDYAGMLQEAQSPAEATVDINAGRIKDAELAHDIANGPAGGYEASNKKSRDRAIADAVADESQGIIDTHISNAAVDRAKADRIYDKVQQTVARAEDTKR